MTTYAWVGRTRNGQIVKGERAAESSAALSEALRREQILVTKVAAAARREKRFRRIPAKNLAIFTRQFSVMIDAGLPLVQCLELLSKEEPDKKLATAIEQVRGDVEVLADPRVALAPDLALVEIGLAGVAPDEPDAAHVRAPVPRADELLERFDGQRDNLISLYGLCRRHRPASRDLRRHHLLVQPYDPTHGMVTLAADETGLAWFVVPDPTATSAYGLTSLSGVIGGNLSRDVNIMGKPAATVDSTADNSPAHIPTPPGTAFQKSPTNEATIKVGSPTVKINGKMAARNGDVAESCNDPADLPVGRVIAVGTVLIG